MQKIVTLIMIAVSVYLVVITGMFINFDIKNELINGIYVIIFMIVFTISVIGITISTEKDMNRQVLYSFMVGAVLGLRTFYKIFIYFDDVQFGGEAQFGFNYFIYHTFFRVSEFTRHKSPEAIAYLIIVGVVVSLSLGIYFRNKNETRIKESTL